MLHVAELDNPELPSAVRACHIVPELASRSLISVAKPGNVGCETTFTKFGTGVKVRHISRLMWLGKKCTRTGQWMVPLKPTSSTHTSAPALPNPPHAVKFITLEGSRTQALRFDLNQAFQSTNSTSMNLPGVTVPHTCTR